MDKFSAQVRELREARPAAVDIRIRVFGSGEGQSEVSMSVSPTGEFADVKREGPARERAFAALLAVVERELRIGLKILGQP